MKHAGSRLNAAEVLQYGQICCCHDTPGIYTCMLPAFDLLYMGVSDLQYFTLVVIENSGKVMKFYTCFQACRSPRVNTAKVIDLCEESWGYSILLLKQLLYMFYPIIRKN